MKYTSIVAFEKKFKETGDANGKQFDLKPFSVTIPGTTETVEMVECVRENEDESFFFKEATTKKRIVLHYTEGYIKGDISTLTKPQEHISVPFVVARDGTIYNLWTSKYWSFHLGSGALGGNTSSSRESIGIEISNIGHLKKVGENLVNQYSNTDIYCALTDTTAYQQLDYRGHKYFATFTSAQYTSVIKLLRFLTKKYNLPRTFLPAEKRYSRPDDIDELDGIGIVSHVNFRTDKHDIGPAFDWARVIAGVQA